MRSLYFTILLLTCFNAYTQDILYVRCIDSDNLERIENFNLKIIPKNLEIIDHKNGIIQLINFKKGTEIIIAAQNYSDKKFQRPDKREEIAMKHNGKRILKSGDTIVIELLANSELLNKRWKEEDQMFTTVDTTSIINKPDTNPNFVNEQDFIKILSSKLHFPNHLIDDGVQGKVILSAIVEIDGSLTNIRILRSLDPLLDRIALRAMRNSELPKLNPATKDKIQVRSQIIFPVNFNLN